MPQAGGSKDVGGGGAQTDSLTMVSECLYHVCVCAEKLLFPIKMSMYVVALVLVIM